MAGIKDVSNRHYWVESAWEIYDVLESGTEKHQPNASTYAIMLLAWHRFNPESSTPVLEVSIQDPASLLTHILDRKISVSHVIADRVFSSSEEAAEIIKILSRAAVNLNFPHVVSELGQAEAIGSQFSDVLDNVPEVNPVLRKVNKSRTEDTDLSEQPQMEVPFNLDVLRRHLSEVTLARRVLPEDVSARQKLLEESVYDLALERLKHQAQKMTELGLGNTALRTQELQQWMWEWHCKLEARLKTELKNIAAAERQMMRDVQPLSPYLSLVKPERLSLITITEIMGLHGSGGVHGGMKTTRALISVGRAVELEYKSQICKENNIHIPHWTSSKQDGVNFFSKMGYTNLMQRRLAAAKHVSDGEGWTAAWSQIVRSKVGGILVDCLMDVAQVTRTARDKKTGELISEEQPAFYHSYEYIRGQKLGTIRLNQVVAERLAKDPLQETLHPRHLPMLMKPKPWLDHDDGGYLYNRTAAMRYKDSMEQQSYLKQASRAGSIELVYASLDVLGSTPWQINKDVFDIVLQVWNSGERLGKLPPAMYDEPEPIPPDNVATDIKAKSIHIQRMKAYNNEKANNHSDRCSVNYKIEIARAFLGDTIYLPHNLDFRGRAYPIPPHLNHIGDDLSRGLLKFAEARPLGERGLRWLKIHLANLYGYDKANFDERVEFVMNHLPDIYDSALNPLNGKRWWTKAEDPWQCLATCVELRNALESGDPHTFMSSLPVHQDGTCNGLQHYAALGGDAQGAKQVNLSAGDRPSDVYTYVGNMVEQRLEEDAAKGEKFALLLKGKVSRKVVKQTVMTTVYGVTFVGARDQIERQLREKKALPQEDCWLGASYLAKQTLAAIGDLFTSATAIQQWLNICARLISKSIPEERIPEAMKEYRKKPMGAPKKHPRVRKLPVTRLKKEQMTSVVWTTGLGLPIVQPYRKSNRKQVATTVQTVYISDPNSLAEVNTLKQASAFPPNFIHSLDATHMMLTALECRTQGLTFASVHDSYWTHASDIDKMSEIIRDTFIALHSTNVLEKLRGEFMARYKGYKLPLSTMQGGLVKQLCESGSRIIVTPEQAKSLESLKSLLVISETERPTIDESEAAKSAESLKEYIAELSDGHADGGETTTADESGDSTEHGEEEDEEEWLSPQAKAARKRKVRDEKAAIELMGKFVNLTDVLPPLPKRGNFRVESIKNSQYFFS
ncbi:DNA/RNA polymerase [Tricholoma matsutake]|nr:DNA/RNA polymerase [Tricholoma matsutake 945]